MQKRLQIVLRYFRYFKRAKTRYSVHSPFVFQFCENILEDQRTFYAFERLETLRKELFKDNRKIQVTDFGAGSHTNNSKERVISSIAKSAVSPASQSQILFKIVEHFKPNTMLEMGTSLGLTAAYQALPHTESKFISLEGCPKISQVAQENWAKLGIENIEIITGEFGNTLEKSLLKLQSLDYVFFDGNHQKEPTIEYFEKCLPYAHADSIFIFDDIHWSEGMEAAWEDIIQHPSVRLSIDLFFMGIIFFRTEQKETEHFTLIPSRMKPWQKIVV